MNPKSLPGVITLILSIFLSVTTKAQSFGALSSAVWLTDCNQSDYYNTWGSGANVIGPAGKRIHECQPGCLYAKFRRTYFKGRRGENL